MTTNVRGVVRLLGWWVGPSVDVVRCGCGRVRGVGRLATERGARCWRELGGMAGGGRGIVGVMSVELIRASGLTDAVPYAYASVVPAGARLVHTAGACPIDEHDRVVALGDVAGQARQVMDNLEVALQAAGAVLTDVVRTTVYVASTDQADLVAAWNVVRARFGDHDAPSTLLGVTVLGYRGQLVEVDAVAVTK
ncbi:enamine deaminase RidA (YjgF/YER057c/UK114 family) [Plantactinospora soyae]|uniref:Enamine deaminase RidA (YjgF/YER057c/UK114 family) n=2 Tax=Plantactinospora soyae TaxID=1544732 RepID=A0A927M479_9ACTN|nr:enamine deaminase RidA (YjgF/YER057c/UK114 family) [Plantactinospora soyae]